MNGPPPHRQQGSLDQGTADPQNWPNMFPANGQPLPRQPAHQSRPAQPYPSQMNMDGPAWGGPSVNYGNQSATQPGVSHGTGNPGVQANDSVLGFMQSMPNKNEDPGQHALWTELVRLKTRTLELQIAEARAKEKEAEAELKKLRQMYSQKGGMENMTSATETGQDVFGSLPMSANGSGQYGQGGAALDMYGQHTRNGSASFGEVDNFTGVDTVLSAAPSNTLQSDLQHAMTTFDLEAMMQHNNLDNLFSWLPDFGETPQPNRIQAPGQVQGVDPNDLFGLGNAQSNMVFQPSVTDTPRSDKPNITSPITRRSHTPDEDEPASKKAKRPEKKVVVEQSSECTVCAKPLAKIMVRAPKSNIPDQIVAQFACPDCKPVAQPPSLSDMYGTGSSHGIGTVDTRKRLRMAMEAEDEDKAEPDARRAFCDVCQRVFGSGMVFGGHARENMASISEFICTGCEGKYSRCTDCGGGGGGRVGIGKWRMKQVFQPGRKTCSLSHTRLGDRPREIGVHVTPTDFTTEELKEVLTRCKQLWNEKTLARLAVPEMLEIDLPSQMTNPIRDYADVEDIVTQNWPNRESMIRAEGADPNRFKRLLGLVWAHSKSRRGTRTVDIEEEWQKKGDGDADDMSTVLDNVKRTNLAIPGGSELIGMWGGEWDMKHGSLLVSTFIPFEGTDGEDSTALSVGEMITKVQMMRQSMNQERRDVAAKQGTQPDLVPQCEHLWVVSGGAMPLVRERIADILVRKRSFVHVDEYLTRHPDFANALSARPVGLHPDVLRPSPSSSESKPPPLILVRWLGKDFDAQKILEIKQAEFGGKGKLKKKVKK